MNAEALKKLTKARAAMIMDQPFFGSLALRLLLVEDNNIKTLAVDGKHVFYNADFIKSLSHELTKSAMAHEVGHCIYDHLSRRGARDPQKWNMAGDFVINDMLKQSGFEIGEDWLYHPSYAGKTSDEIYNILPDMPPSPNNGAGAAGGSLCDIQPGSPDPATQNQQAQDWKIATIQAATNAKQYGMLPGSMQRFIDEMSKPRIDWKERLRHFVSELSKDDYDWTRPNKRLLEYDIVLPTLYNETAGAMALIIDDSGSINDQILSAFSAEIRSIINDVAPSMTHLIYCDSHIPQNGRYDIAKGEELPKFKVHGGGGTDFNPPFRDIDKRKLEPKCLVYLTDGYGPFPPEPPDYPVLWVMTTDVVAPWGETVPLDLSVN